MALGWTPPSGLRASTARSASTPRWRRLKPYRYEGAESAKPAVDLPSDVCNFQCPEVCHFRCPLTGVSELVLSGALRILTHPRIFYLPTSVEDAGSFVDSILAQHGFSARRPGFGHWRSFRSLVRTYSLTGNRVPNAYHAALAIEHGCEWVTLDRGFSVYPGLRCRNLLDS